MQITADYLRNALEDARRQNAEHQAMVNITHGAIQALEQLLARLEETEPPIETAEPDALSMDQVAELVGGNGAVVEGIDHVS